MDRKTQEIRKGAKRCLESQLTQRLLVARLLIRTRRHKEEVMGRERRGVRDGTGPNKSSARRILEKASVGRRKAAGEKCPVAKSKGNK